MHKKIISLTLVLSIPLFLFSQTTYYWYHGKKQPLEEYRERAFIMVDNPNDTTVVNMLLSKQKCQKIKNKHQRLFPRLWAREAVKKKKETVK